MIAHQHAEVIKAWADGHQIQFQRRDGVWHDCVIGCTPAFDLGVEYRVKPQPQVVSQEYHTYWHEAQYLVFTEEYPPNLRLTFEAGQLIDAQFIGRE
jgi:hypothetical protein